MALDDFTWKPGIEPLVELADYIKVDFIQTGAEERKKLLHQLSNYAVALIAEKVETQDEYQQAREEGFTLIQGYYFCRPVLMKNRSVPANRLSQVEILRMLHDDVDRSAQADPAGEAGHLAHLSAAAPDQLAAVRGAPGGVLRAGRR